MLHRNAENSPRNLRQVSSLRRSSTKNTKMLGQEKILRHEDED
jgi:hypothetical protein